MASPPRPHSAASCLTALAVTLLLAGCATPSTPDDTESTSSAPDEPEQIASSDAGSPPEDAGTVTPVGPPDPAELDRMTRGITGNGTLVTTLHTTEGDITCRLYEEKTPVTVANFIGLARGLKPWRSPNDQQRHTQDPFFDGLPFYRVIPGFIIQSGAPDGDPDAGPGYHLPDEFHPDLTHDRPGVLGMASQGPDTAGSQFYITLRAAPHLDAQHPIFGQCRNLDVISRIARRPANANNRPEHPARIKYVTFDRADWSASSQRRHDD